MKKDDHSKSTPRLPEQLVESVFEDAGLTVLNIPERFTQVRVLIEKKGLMDEIKNVAEAKNPREFWLAYQMLIPPYQVLVEKIIGSVYFAVLKKYDKSDFVKKYQVLAREQCIALQKVIRPLERKKLPFTVDFDRRGKNFPVYLCDFEQLLKTFRYFEENKSKGKTGLIFINKQDCSIPDLQAVRKKIFNTESKIENQGTLYFIIWLICEIETKLLSNNTTEKEIYEKIEVARSSVDELAKVDLKTLIKESIEPLLKFQFEGSENK